MRLFTRILFAMLLVLAALPARAGDTAFQYSTIDALLGGLFDGDMTLEELKFKGDFGLGTLNGIDGELIVLEGQAYHAKAGGKVSVPADSSKVPFAAVAFFQEDTILKLDKTSDLEQLNQAVLSALPSPNLFYAIRIDTRFNHIKTRAIPKQNEPYRPLAEVAKEQVVVQQSGEGTLVGIYSPPFVKGVGVTGFHWHFVTKERSGGGHVLGLDMPATVARVDTLHEFTVRFPKSKAYDRLDLTGDKSGELHAVEKDSK